MIHQFYAQYDNVLLRPLEEDDIEKLRVWRNNTEETRFLKKIDYITPQMQKEWYENYQKDTLQVVFAIVETKELKRCVGSLALYDIKDSIAEIGKIQIGDSEAHRKGIGRKSLVMAMKIAFEIMGLTKIVASVNEANISAKTNDLRIGFQIVGDKPSERGGVEHLLEIDRNRLVSFNDYFNDIMLGEGYGK